MLLSRCDIAAIEDIVMRCDTADLVLDVKALAAAVGVALSGVAAFISLLKIAGDML